MEVEYVRDIMINGRTCRLLRSSGEIWLKDLNVKGEDLLPAEEVNRPGGSIIVYSLIVVVSFFIKESNGLISQQALLQKPEHRHV